MKALVPAVLLLLTTFALAQDAAELFQQTFPTSLGPLDQQAFCAENERDEHVAHRPHELQRIASVTKLFTTLLALESMALDQRWITTFTLADERLHIAGGDDPWFEEEKALALIDALKTLGVRRLKEITFDQALRFEDSNLQSYQVLTPTTVAQALRRYFTPSGKFTAQANANRAAAADIMREQGADFALPTSGIATARVRFSLTNPLVGTAGARTFTHTSRTLRDVLKGMNVYSKNKVAQNLWELALQRVALTDVLDKHQIPRDEVSLRNGSGLPFTSPQRFDNAASCAALLKLLRALEEKAQDLGVDRTSIIGLGVDLGTLQERFLDDLPLKQGIMAKTGTIRDASTLAGWISSDHDYRFAVLNQTASITNARSFQDRFMSLWMKQSGGTRPLVYSPISLYPLEGAFLDEHHPVADR